MVVGLFRVFACSDHGYEDRSYTFEYIVDFASSLTTCVVSQTHRQIWPPEREHYTYPATIYTLLLPHVPSNVSEWIQHTAQSICLPDLEVNELIDVQHIMC